MASPITLVVKSCNIRGLHSYFDAVYHHLEIALFFLTETQIPSPACTSYFTYPRYLLEHSFISKAGAYVYVREDISFRSLNNLEGRDISILWLRVNSDNHPRVSAII